jgi:hypothetical protein
MSLPASIRLVVASYDEDGEADFIDTGPPATRHVPNVSDSTYFWRAEKADRSGKYVGGPGSPGVVAPGGSVALMMAIPAHSAGKSDVDFASLLGSGASGGFESNPAMHSTLAIDYVLVLSGRIDVVLPGDRRRTLRAGDFLVITGVAHAWENHYDEVCTCLVVTVGASRDPDRPPPASG